MGPVGEFGGFIVVDSGGGTAAVTRTHAVNLPSGLTVGHVGLGRTGFGRGIAGIVEFTRPNGQVVNFGVPVGWETAMYAEATRAVVGAFAERQQTKAWFFFQRWV